ncbi:Alpha/Beta hydrolase protein [Dimargaris cristalligena]|uniref:Protein phosphatase methylesterase 1 n=1 Tax=Dimargaris cristalligena TaxID=215637 RepID=A0A4P9ZS53_9FUNG|nr:Alpha/Beta hydrolase protein [Dimargaris cristalligena]|eukprot:RKP36364.1 Alpha/Beta hydrolase protein [Dimargaris cristalligena]
MLRPFFQVNSPSNIIHSSGFSYSPNYSFQAESWELYFEERRVLQCPDTDNQLVAYLSLRSKGPLFVLHHGAGHAALAFALVAKIIRDKHPEDVSILAYDCRGHGGTHTSDDLDLSLDTLSNDLGAVVRCLYPDGKLPEIFLVGHSMGGAVVTHAAYNQCLPNIIGLVVIDIVEGNAMAALGKIKAFCDMRPHRFRSVSHVIQWFLDIHAIANPQSAQVSVPPLVIEARDEENENEVYYTWRTDLQASERYWKEWFQNLTEKFLQSKASKMLMLAGPERLDKPMMIAQMQGKFQPAMFPDSGHAIQEDHPERVAQNILDFWQRHRRLTLPPKLPK